jgi:hypothetical protein
MDECADAVGVPGVEGNAIDVDAVGGPPVYDEGTVPGVVVDLTQGEEESLCFICLEARGHEGQLCNRVQACCEAQSHVACFFPWALMQQQEFGNVSCPHCRTIEL